MRKLNDEIADVLALPEIREKMSVMGLDVAGGTPQRLGTYIGAEYAKWVKVVPEAGIRTD